MKKITFIILTAITLFFVLGFACNKKQTAEEKLRDALPVVIPSPLPVINQFVTPKDALIGTNLAVTPDNISFSKNAVDNGLDLLFQSTANLGYQNWTNHNPYTVIITNPTSRSETGNCPTFNLKNGTKIAGIVISVGNPNLTVEPPFILVASDFAEDEFCKQFLTYAVRFEGEHIIAWYNDKTLFYSRTGLNDIHPIYPLSDGNFKGENNEVIKALQPLLKNDVISLKDLDIETQKQIRPILAEWYKYRTNLNTD